MKIKDIVNRSIATLTNCEHEPIHIPGQIQPHGFLLAITQKGTIDFCSENIQSFLGISHAQVLGKSFSEIFGAGTEKEIFDYIQADVAQTVFPLSVSLYDKLFQISIHQSGDLYVLEAEIQPEAKEKLADVYMQIMQFVTQMNNTTSLKDLCALVAEGTRKITGYDRVMIYRFDDQYNGEVYAESSRTDLEAFLGLHYPHTDIPAQARELYMRNDIRLIVDIDYEPVPIYTIDDADSKNLDLSLSVLRSTSPIHVEYLKNIGVGATLTISLIHDNRLWGLIACHHYSSKYISPEVKLAAKLQGQFITSQIDIRQSNDENVDARKAIAALERLSGLEVPLVQKSVETIVNASEILEICNAAGVCIVSRNKIYKKGLVPSDEKIEILLKELVESTNDNLFYTNKLSTCFSALGDCPDFCGIIYHSLGNSDHIIWFRPETITEKIWGGDPEKAIIKDSTGLHPRNSFEIWKQIIKNQSSVWKGYEISSAVQYAHVLHNQLIMIMLSEEEEKYRTQSEILKETNSELENLNWISTHDLQEPLRKIQLFTSKMMTDPVVADAPPLMNSLQKVSKSADRMRILLDDILQFSRIKYTRESLHTVNLNQILHNVLRDLEEKIAERNAIISYENLPEVHAVDFLMVQLFSNIIQNSLKFASSERQLAVTVTASKEPELVMYSTNIYCHWIRFSDNGIGFEQQYAEKIFKVFARLHNQDEYGGSGVGLALCKKIMQTVGGTIWANGKLNEGADLIVYFPCDPQETLL
jgi:chemotaxis family two-component system sensor kinase Cph1